MYEYKKLFDFSIERIKETGDERGLKMPQAFAVWFAYMYFSKPQNTNLSDGPGDGKVDFFFRTAAGETFEHHIINSKFTNEYRKLAPVSFYDEITRFWQAFANKSNRTDYLKAVRKELRKKYLDLFKHYDNGKAKLMFLTNHRRNEKQFSSFKKCPVRIFHLEDILQFVIDHIEGAMPHTPGMLLTGINSVLTPDTRDTEVPTSIVFGRAIDLIKYMEKDPYDLLFARNVRLWLKKTPVNEEIEETFRMAPKEFAFSNNGITMLCATQNYVPGRKELNIENPRIVNGSQTLHSIRNVENPSRNARVMLKIIEISPTEGEELTAINKKRRDIINKISIRTNRQNPIKKWDLVSNDAFQNELARYFRQRKLFYERRQKEWSVRSSDLKSIGIRKGPNIKELAQFIASYYVKNKTLGPAIAKVSVSGIFEEKPYAVIRETSTELAYQIYLLSKILNRTFKDLSSKRKYIKNYSGHIKFALFSVLVILLKSEKAKWNKDKFTKFLEEHDGYMSMINKKLWEKLVKGAIDHINQFYKEEKKKYKKQKGKELTFNNYFKSKTYVEKILDSRMPRALRTSVRRIL